MKFFLRTLNRNARMAIMMLQTGPSDGSNHDSSFVSYSVSRSHDILQAIRNHDVPGSKIDYLLSCRPGAQSKADMRMLDMSMKSKTISLLMP